MENMVRLAEYSDFERVLCMCEKFWEETIFDEKFDPEHAVHMLELSLSYGLLAVVNADGVPGFIAGIKSPLLCSREAFIGTEIGFYLEPDYRNYGLGREMIQYIEIQAAQRGIKYWNMITIESGEPLAAQTLYESMGYKLIETSWIKRLL